MKNYINNVNQNNCKLLNLEELKSVCEKLYKTFVVDTLKYSDTVKKYATIFENEIVGQENAKKLMCEILEQIKANLILRDEGYNKPIASILFAGPSGVGKTKMARIMQKALNEFFGENNELIKINCADYQGEQPYSLTRLIGASAGYIGSDRKPKLHPDNIKGKGRIILFDEIEKAGTPLKNILLSILDDGELEVNYTNMHKIDNTEDYFFEETQNKNNKDTYENTSYVKSLFKDKIIILTSNIGIGTLQQKLENRNIGFTKSDEKINIDSIIKKELSNHFKIELQGRFDYIVSFSYLEKNDVEKIIEMKLNKIITKVLQENNYLVIFSDKVKNFIIDKIYQDKDLKKYGGRYIEHFLNKNILIPLSKVINKNLHNKKKRKNLLNNIIYITENNKNIEFSVIPSEKLQ